MGGARRSIPSEERVFSLILALVASPAGLTKHELLSSVYGYADRYRPGVANDALDRQFDRDKEQVRALGIPIETVDSPDAPGNNQLTRYRISKTRLQVPPNVRFTARELSLLRLASLAWTEGSLSAESRRASMKLAALGAGVELRHLGIAPHLGIPEPAAPGLQAAIDEGRVVRFAYQLPDRDEPLQRRVAPLRLHRADGRWHLLGWDLDRGSGRVFLLSRIVGPVRAESEWFDEDLRRRADALVARLLERREQELGTLDARLGSAAEARLLARAQSSAPSPEPGWIRVTVGTLDPHAFAEELAGYGPDLIVVEPADLAERVRRVLERVREQHRAATAVDGSSG